MASSEDLTSAESGSSWLPHRKAADGQLQRWVERMEGIHWGTKQPVNTPISVLEIRIWGFL